MPMPALYRMVARLPRKYSRKYRMDVDRTSAGVRIQVRMVGVKNTPRRVSSTPQHRAKAMSVCTAERTFS